MILAGALALAALPASAQTAYRAPRAEGGKPDLNGIWQSMNEANFDLAMELRVEVGLLAFHFLQADDVRLLRG